MFVLFHNKRHPNEMGTTEITEFFTHLAVKQKVSASTQNQAFFLLLFYTGMFCKLIYRISKVSFAKRTEHLPVVFTPTEVKAILDNLKGVSFLAASLLYGSGLRLTEALHLRIKDIDFEMMNITVRDGKGAKDRTTLLPESLREPLTAAFNKGEIYSH